MTFPHTLPEYRRLHLEHRPGPLLLLALSVSPTRKTMYIPINPEIVISYFKRPYSLNDLIRLFIPSRRSALKH